MRQTLTQSAWAASHTKNTYLAAQFRRLAARRGKKRALVATGHTLLVIVYHVIKHGMVYRELGGDYLERLNPERMTRYHVKHLERLGHKVTLEPQPEGPPERGFSEQQVIDNPCCQAVLAFCFPLVASRLCDPTVFQPAPQGYV